MIIAIDAGTTSCRSVLYSKEGQKIGFAQKDFSQIMPKPGWVEHDAMEIWKTVQSTLEKLLIDQQISTADISAIGMTNQRETTVVWDQDGQPIHNALVWQDTRTKDLCNQLILNGHGPLVREKTGLVIDSYFSCTKLQWLLNHHSNEAKRLFFGTIDTWLIYQLTKGQAFVTDATNASRTGLFNIHTLKWDEELCQLFQVPMDILPQVVPNNQVFGMAQLHGQEIPIHAVLGDQQAALYGQECFLPGQAKNTYGTGCFLLQNIGDTPSTHDGLLTTIAQWNGQEATYALEGSVFVGGSVIQWLRDQIGLIPDAAASQSAAKAINSNGGVYFVPAFSGMGSPHWNMDAQGMLLGLTRATTHQEITRAALESIAFQSADVLDAMMDKSGHSLPFLKADGGATENQWLMQFQADILQKPVHIPKDQESTARGVALMAAQNAGWTFAPNSIATTYEPQMSASERNVLLEKWHKAVEICKLW